MLLNDNSIQNAGAWEKIGVKLPSYSREIVAENTKKSPTWIHFGAGNIFRAFPAAVLNDALEDGSYDRGVIVAEGFDYDIITKAYRPFDNLSLLVTLKSDGTTEKKVIASVTEALIADQSEAADWSRLEEIFAAPSLQMVSFTITEKGYQYLGKGGAMEKLTTLMLHRFRLGKHPVALVSMDNVSQNGAKLSQSVHAIAAKWVEDGAAPVEFVEYLSTPSLVSFPWSMIDKITPHPDASVQNVLESAGLRGMEIISTEKNTKTAAFVNAEEVQYMVIEDAFPAGRPPIERSGILFAAREVVNKIETMKVTTCLNPLHTALAVLGCLLNYKTIHSEMKDPDLLALVKKLGYQEGMPVVVDPGIIHPKKFLDEVIEIRFPNPFIPDTPQRIATDTSQKLAIRFGETIKSYAESDSLSTHSLEAIPFVLAAWCRYLMGIDDSGIAFTISPDPRLEETSQYVKAVSLGDTIDPSILRPLLQDATLFGVNLYEVGLGEKVEAYFAELISGTGAVRKTLRAVVN